MGGSVRTIIHTSVTEEKDNPQSSESLLDPCCMVTRINVMPLSHTALFLPIPTYANEYMNKNTGIHEP